jgi:hypothetical protein
MGMSRGRDPTPLIVPGDSSRTLPIAQVASQGTPPESSVNLARAVRQRVCLSSTPVAPPQHSLVRDAVTLLTIQSPKAAYPDPHARMLWPRQ